MPAKFSMTLVAAALFGLALAPASLEAQGRGNSPAARGTPDYGYDHRASAQRGPPFCQTERGHPVHGRQWCIDKGFGVGSLGRYSDRDRYDDRRGSSYQQDHEEFHRYLDRKYNELAARRPLDIAYQAQLRLDKRAEHDEWHRRAGIRH